MIRRRQDSPPTLLLGKRADKGPPVAIHERAATRATKPTFRGARRRPYRD